MRYVAILEDTETGGRVTVEEEADCDCDVLEFMWTEGNYSCDCNRRLFFLRAQGEDPDVGGDGWCGEMRYRLVSLEAGGKMLAQERA